MAALISNVTVQRGGGQNNQAVTYSEEWKQCYFRSLSKFLYLSLSLSPLMDCRSLSCGPVFTMDLSPGRLSRTGFVFRAPSYFLLFQVDHNLINYKLTSGHCKSTPGLLLLYLTKCSFEIINFRRTLSIKIHLK